MKNLYIIDGHSLIFRMYFAFLRTPMVNSKGQDTSILFGFTKFLLELINKERPTHIAVAFDPPGKTFRHELNPDYKATRNETPELVKEALDSLTEIVKSLNIPVIMRPGYEADDIIGSLAKQYERKGFEVYMVTPDKDLGQIISDNIYQYKPGKGKEEKSIIGKKEICEHYGITTPEQVIDILTLWGDTADNVKGVAGVGEVSAKKLIAKYGTVENIYEHLDDLTPKMHSSFVEALNHISLSKQLITIKTDIDLDITEDELCNRIAIRDNFSRLISDYEMPSLLKLVGDNQSVFSSSVTQAIESKEISQTNLFEKVVECGKTAFRMNDETVWFAVNDNFCKTEIDSDFAVSLFTNEKLEKIGHGIKQDILKLKAKGIELTGKLKDLEIIHYIINPERTHKLDILANSYLNVDITTHSAIETNEIANDLFSNQYTVAQEDMARFQREACILMPLCDALDEELRKSSLERLYYEIEEPLISVLADMESVGVKIDPEQLNTYSKELATNLVSIEDEARKLVDEPDLNLSSVRQVGNVIYEKLKLNPKAKKKNNNYPTDEETLNELADKHPFVSKVLEYRGVKKLLSTYVLPLPDLMNKADGKIHTTFNQALTATGRLSSAKPNLQNIPIRTDSGKEIRKAFVSSFENGYIVSADYSQIELRIMAELSGDKSLIEGFRNGADIHAATAAKIFKEDIENVTKEQRRKAKTANFGIIYGISAFGLSQRLGISRNESKQLIEGYFQNYPKVKEYMDNAVNKAKEKGFVETLFGRRRFLPDINSKNQVVRGLAERNAVNAPIQGTAADIIKIAMTNVAKLMRAGKFKSQMVLQVHDELIFDVCPEELERLITMIKNEMEGVCKLSIPLTVECSYGKNWLEAH